MRKGFSMRVRKGPFVAALLAGLTILVFRPASIEGAFAAPEDETERIETSITVIRELVELPEVGVPEALLHKAQGIAIIPGVLQAAYGIGGQYGKGVVLVRGDDGRWGWPSFIRLFGGSIGWQIGVQKSDIILVFKTRQGLEKIATGRITLGADIGVSAGPIGRRAEASTDLEFEAEIYSYSRSKGLFAGVSIKGASLQVDEEANEAFYGRKGLDPHEILAGRELKAPDAAAKLREVVATYTSDRRRI